MFNYSKKLIISPGITNVESDDLKDAKIKLYFDMEDYFENNNNFYEFNPKDGFEIEVGDKKIDNMISLLNIYGRKNKDYFLVKSHDPKFVSNGCRNKVAKMKYIKYEPVIYFHLINE